MGKIYKRNRIETLERVILRILPPEGLLKTARSFYEIAHIVTKIVIKRNDNRGTVFTVLAKNITEADISFLSKIGTDPARMNDVYCVAHQASRADLGLDWGGAKVW
jgi:hypothetical protein